MVEAAPPLPYVLFKVFDLLSEGIEWLWPLSSSLSDLFRVSAILFPAVDVWNVESG
jgi:hypothetical protein